MPDFQAIVTLLGFINQISAIEHKYCVFTSREQLKNLLQNLETAGLFTQDLESFLGRPMELTNDRLFYLVSAIHDPEIPVWKPYWPVGFADENF